MTNLSQPPAKGDSLPATIKESAVISGWLIDTFCGAEYVGTQLLAHIESEVAA